MLVAVKYKVDYVLLIKRLKIFMTIFPLSVFGFVLFFFWAWVLKEINKVQQIQIKKGKKKRKKGYYVFVVDI